MSVETKAREWPETVCSTDHEYRADLTEPIRCGDWIVCTNGQAMVVVADDGRDASSPGDALSGRVSELVESTVAPMTWGRRFDMSALMEWLGPAVEDCPDCDSTGPCEECDGYGYVLCTCIECGVEHEADCRECYGRMCKTCHDRGALTPASRRYKRARIGDVLFNRRLLALALEGAPGDEVAIQATDAGENGQIQLAGDGWYGMVMPLRRDSVGDISEIEEVPS